MKEKLLFVFMFIAALVMLASKIDSGRDEKFETENPEQPSGDWFERQREFPFDEIPNDERLKSIEYVKHMPISDAALITPWVLAGPTNIEGRITTISIHPANPQIVYIGTANGGMWKSTNFCQSWVSIFDNENTSSIGAIAIDPVNPDTIYCGTGEANALRSYYPGTGMYKSTDGGSSWSFLGLGSTYSFGKIEINPLNTQEVYAAAIGSTRRKNVERGLYKSTNGGSNWSLALFHSDSVGAIDVILNPSNPSKLFCAMWERQRREDYIKYGGPMSALYMSTNSGLNWAVVNGGFPSNAADLGRTSLDIAVSNPQIIYALTAFANGNTRGLYKTTDGGTSWTLINSSAAGSSNYAWFNRSCTVNPSDPNMLLCGGMNMERSINGGTSFSSVGVSHVDQHAGCFAPSNPGFVVVGNDGGVDVSTDGGASWSSSPTLPITQFYAGDVDFNNTKTIMGGAQDNGTPRTLTGNSNDWEDIYGGDGFYCLIDYTTSQRVYASSQNGGIGRSTNGGATFSNATSGLDLTYTNWMTPYVMDKTNPLILYCGTYKIHKTINGMQSWTVISPDLTNGHVQNLGTITTVDVSKSNPNVIYCGTDDANVWVTTDGGGAWTKINTGLPYRWVTRVAVHPDSANVCYVTLSGYKVDSTGAHIFRTTNYGSNWVSVSGNLPDAPVNVVVIDPVLNGTLYVGTDVGVMTTANFGATWTLLSPGIPSSVPCHDLKLHNPTRKLFVWTHGRSAYTMQLDPIGIINESQNAYNFSLNQNYPNPFNPKTVINYQLAAKSFVSMKVYDLLGKEIAVLVNGEMNAGTYKAEFDGTNYPSGVYFYKLESGGFTKTNKMILIK